MSKDNEQEKNYGQTVVRLNQEKVSESSEDGISTRCDANTLGFRVAMNFSGNALWAKPKDLNSCKQPKQNGQPP